MFMWFLPPPPLKIFGLGLGSVRRVGLDSFALVKELTVIMVSERPFVHSRTWGQM